MPERGPGLQRGRHGPPKNWSVVLLTFGHRKSGYDARKLHALLRGTKRGTEGDRRAEPTGEAPRVGPHSRMLFAGYGFGGVVNQLQLAWPGELSPWVIEAKQASSSAS